MRSWSRSLGPNRQLQRRLWLLIRNGMGRQKAALALGLNEWTGRAWFRQASGVIPAYVPTPRSIRCLSEEERIEIFGGIQRGDSIRGMARTLNRAPSSVLRELRRNGQLDRRRLPSGPMSRAGGTYRPT